MRLGILLHGRNREPDEMLQIAAKLDVADVRWLAPAADNGTWYPQRFMEPLASNEPFLSRAVEQCHALIGEADDVVMVGFSQGACLAVEYVLRHPGRCRTVVVFTGGLIGPDGTQWPTPDLAGTRALITGSDIDEWVPERRVRETASLFTRLGADVRLRIHEAAPIS
jgi:predicted esterase